MVKLGLAVFGLYFFLLGLDQMVFHRKRNLEKPEILNACIDSALLILCIATVLFVEYSTQTKAVFGVLALLSMLSITKNEYFHAQGCSWQELWLHSLIFMFHPLMLITLGALWPVVDGASFFMNIVLPFSTTHLRPLCFSYMFAMIGMLVVQVLSLNRVRSEAQPVPEQAESPARLKAVP